MNEEVVSSSEVVAETTVDIPDINTCFDTLYQYQSANVVLLIAILVAVCADLGVHLATAFWKR